MDGGGSSYSPNPPVIPPDEEECEHDFSEVVYDENIHWTKCSKCDEKMENSEDVHEFGEITDDGGITGTHSCTCTFEGCECKQTNAHEFDENGQCTECGATQDTGCEHNFSEVGNDDTYHWTSCSTCGAIQEESKREHELGGCENNYDGTHSAKCSTEGCNYEVPQAHEFGEDGKCENCDATACEEGEHDFSVLTHNEEQHWLACTWCERAKKDSIGNHKFDEWTTNADGQQEAECTECGYIKTGDAQNPIGGSTGDVNEDGEINVTDLIIIKRHVIAVSKTEWILTGNKLTLADINNDGNVDVTDVIMLKRNILASL